MSDIKDYIREVFKGRKSEDGSISIDVYEYNRLHREYPTECVEVQVELAMGKTSCAEVRKDLPSSPPKPPVGRILYEGVGKTCEKCGSSMKRRWFKLVGCVQPLCENYYNRNKMSIFEEEASRTLEENLTHYKMFPVYIDRDGNAHLNIYNKDVQDKIKKHVESLKE